MADQLNRGMRAMVRPGARSWRTVASTLMATARAATATTIRPRMSRSMPSPLNPSPTGRGALRVQPPTTSDASGAAATMPAPPMKSQSDRAWTRGKAIRAAPICSGRMAVTSPSHRGSRKRNTMIVPCMVKSWR